MVNYRTLEQIAVRTSLIIDFGGGVKSDEDNLKRIYWEVSNASLCFELTIEEIIKFTDIQEIILNTMETDLLLDQQRELIESIHKKKLNLTVIVSTFNNWNNDIFSLVSNIIVELIMILEL